MPILLREKNRLYQTTSGKFKLGPSIHLRDILINAAVRGLSQPAQGDYSDAFYQIDVYNPVKFFNPITLIESNAVFDFYDQETSFKLQKGNPYVGIHLHSRIDSVTSRSQIQDSLEKMAVYIKRFRDRLPSDTIIGMSYDKLARLSRRYGFRVAETSLPADIKKRYVEYAAKVPDKPPFDLSDPKICFQTCDEFIAGFPINRRGLKR